MNRAILDSAPTHSNPDAPPSGFEPGLRYARLAGPTVRFTLPGQAAVLASLDNGGACFLDIPSPSDDELFSPPTNCVLVGEFYAFRAAQTWFFRSSASAIEGFPVPRFGEPVGSSGPQASVDVDQANLRGDAELRFPRGSAAAVLHAMRQPPHLHSSVVDALERRIESGRLPLSEPPDL